MVAKICVPFTSIFKYSFLLLITGAILLGLMTKSATAVNNGEVALYGLYETTIDFEALSGQPHSYPDPFYGVDVQVTFSSPAGKQITWWGFYDGDGLGGQTGNIWKIRFMPDALGHWSYTWQFSDGSLSGSGSFPAVDNTTNPRKPGPLQHYPNIHQWFITADKSKHIFPNMYNEWPAESNEPYVNPQASLLEVKNNNFDVIVLWSTMYQNSTMNSFNPIIWNDTNNYVPRLQGWHLMENGIYKEAYDNNIYIYEWDGFYSGNNLYNLYTKSTSFQNKVIKYWLLRTAPYYIFLYNIGFELPEYVNVPTWPVERAEFIKSIDPWGHMITGHELHGWSYSNESVVDFSALQNDDNFHERALQVWNSPSQPHPHCSECIWNAPWQSGGTEASHRKDLWDGITGGMSNFLYAMDNTKGLASFKHANSFLNSGVKWWTMSPHDEVLTGGAAYVLANPGVDYLVYSSSGNSFSLNISAGNYQWRWFDPANGTYSAWTMLNAPDGDVTFSKPNSNDWVLFISGSGSDSTPPTTPQSLSATPKSESQIDLTWQVSSDPESGIIKYNVYRDDRVAGQSTTNSFSDNGLNADTAYTYEVSAVNGAGLESSMSVSASATTFIGTPLPTNGLVGYWKLDDGNGSNVADSSGNGNNGTSINGPTWITGKFGQALNFDGINDYVEINDHNSLKPSNITVSAWVNISIENNWMGIVAKMESSAWDKGFGLSLDDQVPKNFIWWINDETSRTSIPTTSGWTHLVGTYDGLVLKFYKNGALIDALNDTSGIIHHTKPVMIGNVLGGYYWNGMIDQVRIYNRALAAAEIQALYNEGTVDTTPPPPPLRVRTTP